MPEREPDRRLVLPTRADQALLYRLLGDRAPIHADPDTARRAGFPRPLLHGLCTWGIACRAVMQAFDLAPEAIRTHAARFSAPVLPGETIDFRFWREDTAILFEARVVGRDAVVLRSGRTELTSS